MVAALFLILSAGTLLDTVLLLDDQTRITQVMVQGYWTTFGPLPVRRAQRRISVSECASPAKEKNDGRCLQTRGYRSIFWDISCYP